jgi:hypothetical protein
MNKQPILAVIIGLLMVGVSGSSQDALAQEQFNLGSVQLQRGSILPVSSLDTSQPQYFYADTVVALNLQISQPIFNSNGQVMVPPGAKIYGQLHPVPGGLQFVSNSIVLNGRSYPLRALSQVLHDEKDPRQYSSDAVIGDAGLGAVAGLVFSAVSGGVTTANVLGGAAAGILTGNITAPQAVVIRPGQTLTLTLQDPVSIDLQ